MTTIISALFDDYETASAAVRELELNGLPSDEISIVANNADDWYDRRTTVVRDEGTHAGAGAGIGAMVVGAAGLLAGLGMLAIPGIGPVVAAGWLASTAAGAVVGAAGGGILGSLTRAGVDEDEAHVYAEGVRRGGTLVSARVPDTERARYETILNRSATRLTEREAVYREGGWTSYDPAAAPYTADEVRRERERYRDRVL